jgi:diacylglycerol kinase (ATP)
MGAMHALLVHNPTAGSGRPTGEALLAILDEAGFSTNYCSSKQDDFKDALGQPADIVIAAGGDGTVAKVARNLRDRATLVGILPLGTANNVARCLGITGDAERLAARLRGAPVKRLDVGSAAGPWGKRHFLESVGWGGLAKAVDRGVPKLKGESKIASGRESFAQIIAEAEPCRVCFEADGNRVEGDFIFVEILNLGMTGPRVLISPSAEPGDQLLDIVYLTAERKQEMIDWLMAKPDDTPIPLNEIKARKATLVWREGPLRVDDEVFDAPELENNVLIDIEKEGLRVCVPAIEG